MAVASPSVTRIRLGSGDGCHAGACGYIPPRPKLVWTCATDDAQVLIRMCEQAITPSRTIRGAVDAIWTGIQSVRHTGRRLGVVEVGIALAMEECWNIQSTLHPFPIPEAILTRDIEKRPGEKVFSV